MQWAVCGCKYSRERPTPSMAGIGCFADLQGLKGSLERLRLRFFAGVCFANNDREGAGKECEEENWKTLFFHLGMVASSEILLKNI